MPKSKSTKEPDENSSGDNDSTGKSKTAKPKTTKKSAGSRAKPKAKAKSRTRPTKKEQPEVTENSESKDTITSFIGQIKDYTGRVTSSAIDVAKATTAVPLMFTDNWLKDIYMKSIDPERLSSMVDAGRFLQDAREVAGLNLQELAEAVGLTDTELLEEVEKGKAVLPFDMILRIASLIARHDPIPFILKFVRTYSPELEQKMEQWGISSLPRQYERERRFTNIIRKHDMLRDMTDDEFDRFIGYQENTVAYALEIMAVEKSAYNRKNKD